MASSSLPTSTTAFTVILLITLSDLSIAIRQSAGIMCYKSIISFGDSLADTGNLLCLNSLSSSSSTPHFFRPPYGETYFHHPTGRCSDGRLVIDFIAESLGLPLVPPYLGDEGKIGSSDFFEGVNFAVAGASALDDSFFREKGIHNPSTNVSLTTQLGWFKEMLQSSCKKSPDCKDFLQSSLVLMGEIGGNDYNHPLLQGKSIEEVQSFVPLVVHAISSATQELIELGAVTFVVPGNFPIGCSAAYLTRFQSSNKQSYDLETGCIKWLNDFAMYHNKLLLQEINRIRKLYPHATIIYADYYNAAMSLYRFPDKYGFREVLKACCGGGGPYNYNSCAQCGNQPTTCCLDPSAYVCWDGLHLTEAAYRWIAQGILNGPYSIPPISTLCSPGYTSSGLRLES